MDAVLFRDPGAVDFSDYLLVRTAGREERLLSLGSRVPGERRLRWKGEAVITTGGVRGQVNTASLVLRSGPGPAHKPVTYDVYSSDFRAAPTKSSTLKQGALVIVWAKTERTDKLYGQAFPWYYIQFVGSNGPEGHHTGLREKAWVYGQFVTLK